MRFTVGGEEYDLTNEGVVVAMRGVPSEVIQKHLVEVDGRAFPPKQVFAAVTGRARQSFTTMEAQRVLSRLGFVCRRAELVDRGAASAASAARDDRCAALHAQVAALISAVGTIEAAIAGLHTRVQLLEASGPHNS